LEVHLVQNLGGRVNDSLNALLYLDALTKGQIIKEAVIIHHTG
jgi:carbonic anhydrase